MKSKTKKNRVMYYSIERTEEEIDHVINRSNMGIDNGSKYPGMSYEDGVKCAIEWITGDSEDNPFE